MTADGQKPVWRRLSSDEEFKAALNKKFIEEHLEFAVHPNIEELVDMAEVAATLKKNFSENEEYEKIITDILRLNDWTRTELQRARGKKLAEKGGLEKRIFLVSADYPK